MVRQCFLLILLFLQPLHVQTKRTRSDDDDPLQAVVDQLSADLVSLQAQVNVQKAALADQTSEMAAQKSAFERRIAELEAFNNKTVAFSAYISDEPRVDASEGSIIPFHGIISNAGGAFNPTSSVFTAPQDGHYFFIVHADCSEDYRSIQVNVNGHHVFAADNDSDDGHVTGSGLLNLKAGDDVSATHYTSIGYLDAGNESTFSGFLVK